MVTTTTTLQAPEVVALALKYPTNDRLGELRASVDSRTEGSVRRELRQFLTDIDDVAFSDLEELYTSTFDLSPVVVPYVGHLAWGDSYERGGFMADLLGAMRDVDVDPDGELPDHLEPILRYLAATDEPVDGLQPILVPAITKMEKALKKADSKNPYLHVLAAAHAVATERLR